MHTASTPLSGEFAEPGLPYPLLAPSGLHLGVLQPSASDATAGGEEAGRRALSGAAADGVIEWCHFRPFVRQQAALSGD